MLAIASSILMVLHPASQLAPPNPEWNCDDPQVQQEMNWCAAREYAVADAAMNAQWSETSARMKARDASFNRYQPEGDGRAGYFQTLLNGQRAWLSYRDAHCQLDGYTARGGSLEPLLVSTCKTALTTARTQELKELASSPD